MKRKPLIILAAGFAAFFACGIIGSWLERRNELRANQLPPVAYKAISSGSSLKLYSLDPSPIQPPDPNTGFHGFRVLGETPVTESSARDRISDTLRRGLDSWRFTYGSCFLPRHGLRATLSGRSYDLVICFECAEVRYYPPDGTEDGYHGLGKAADSKLIADILRAADVPIAQE